MESSSKSARSNKRRRIILSYVSPPRPDLPAIFESLNDDTLTSILEFVGGKSYRSFGGVNKRCKEVYLNIPGMTKETFLYGYAPLVVIQERYDRASYLSRDKALGKGVVCYNRRDVMEWALKEKEKKIIQRICCVAAREERLDILVEVLNNVDDKDVKRFVYRDVDDSAACHGKLNVLKWLETKGISIHKESCAIEAAHGGQLHIMKWLREEKGLELDKYLYSWATDGGQLHVMKWLREQGCPFYYFTFKYAAMEGNLDILQWLYDESCPWPEYIQVREDKVKPELIEWLRSHGYRNRIRSLRG